MKLESNEHFALERRRQGDSQEDTARRYGITQGAISQYETGVRPMTADMIKVFPARLVKVTRAEEFWVLMHRAGIRNNDALLLFGCDMRQLYRWFNDEDKVPDGAFDRLNERLVA